MDSGRESAPTARQEFAAFVENPDDPRYAASREAARLRQAEAARVRQAQRNLIDVRDRWGAGGGHMGSFTVVLAGCSVLISIFTGLGENLMPELLEQKPPGLASAVIFSSECIQDIRQAPDFGLSQIVHGEVWRLITPIFLHFGIAHLLFNTIFLFQLGSAIEFRQGTVRLALVALLSAVLSNLGQYFYSGSPIFGGMSGVDYARFGYLWMQSRYAPWAGLHMPRETVFFLLVWLVLCMTGTVGPIANAAHAVGFGVGIALGITFAYLRK